MMAATKNGTTNILLNEGTEASPKNVLDVATDINDAAFIQMLYSASNTKVVVLKKHIDLSSYWLLIPDNIELIFESEAYIAMNSTSAGLWLSGGSRITISGATNVVHYNQFKKGTFKCTGLGNSYPIVRNLSGGRSDFPTFDYQQASSADMIYKIDGLFVGQGQEGHHKFYSSNPASYVNNLCVMRQNGYTGEATGLQIRDGIPVYDYVSDIPSIAGDGSGTTATSRMVRPKFLGQTANFDIPVYTNNGTKIDVVDMVFATGSWSGKLKAANAGQASIWGTSLIRFLNTFKYTFYNGITPVNGVKVALKPTALTGTAPSAVYLTTSTSGDASAEVLRSSFSTALSITASNANQKNAWRVTARSYAYDAPFELFASAEPTQSVTQSYQSAQSTSVVSTYAQAAAMTGVTFARESTQITLSAARTTQELSDKARWWLYQDAQMDLADFRSYVSGILNVTDWSISGAENLSGAVVTTGNVTCAAAPTAALNVTAAVITTTGVNVAKLTATTRIDGLPTTGTISTGGKLGFGSGTTINAMGDLAISGTELAGALTINTSVARKLTLTNCAVALTAINVTGGGSLEVRMAGTTPSTIVPSSLPSGVTAGVVVTVTKSGGAAFNAYAVRTDTGASLGFVENGTSVTYVVPKGVSVTFAAWALGYATFVKTIDTSAGGLDYVMDMVPNTSIDTALDVTAYLNNIDTTLATNNYSVVFKAAMELNLTQIKAVVHRIVGRQTSLAAAVAAGPGSSTIEILADEIKINSPIVFLRRQSTMAVTDRVTLNGYINTDPAKAVSATYVVNPSSADGTFVSVLGVKPTVDYSLMATSVLAAGVPTRDQCRADLASVENRLIGN